MSWVQKFCGGFADRLNYFDRNNLYKYPRLSKSKSPKKQHSNIMTSTANTDSLEEMRQAIAMLKSQIRKDSELDYHRYVSQPEPTRNEILSASSTPISTPASSASLPIDIPEQHFHHTQLTPSIHNATSINVMQHHVQQPQQYAQYIQPNMYPMYQPPTDQIIYSTYSQPIREIAYSVHSPSEDVRKVESVSLIQDTPYRTDQGLPMTHDILQPMPTVISRQTSEAEQDPFRNSMVENMVVATFSKMEHMAKEGIEIEDIIEMHQIQMNTFDNGLEGIENVAAQMVDETGDIANREMHDRLVKTQQTEPSPIQPQFAPSMPTISFTPKLYSGYVHQDNKSTIKYVNTRLVRPNHSVSYKTNHQSVPSSLTDSTKRTYESNKPMKVNSYRQILKSLSTKKPKPSPSPLKNRLSIHNPDKFNDCRYTHNFKELPKKKEQNRMHKQIYVDLTKIKNMFASRRTNVPIVERDEDDQHVFQ